MVSSWVYMDVEVKWNGIQSRSRRMMWQWQGRAVSRSEWIVENKPNICPVHNTPKRWRNGEIRKMGGVGIMVWCELKWFHKDTDEFYFLSIGKRI